MKKIFVLTYLFLCFVVGLRAQLNETHLAFHGLNSDDFGRGASVSYFRNFSPGAALGIRANVTGFLNKRFYKGYTGSIDITHRWNFLKNKRFRLLAELGASALKRYDEPVMMYFCGTLSPTESFIPIYHNKHDGWAKATYFGLVGSLGFDIRLGKHIIVGMDCYTGYYQTQSTDYYYSDINPTNVRLRLGTRF